MTEEEIRNHIFFTLARLYEDPLHRTQYKRFTFKPPDRKPAQKILTRLTRNNIVEQLQPGVVRLTDWGYQLIQSDMGKAGTEPGYKIKTSKQGMLPFGQRFLEY